jgi:hypothetical protein
MWSMLMTLWLALTPPAPRQAPRRRNLRLTLEQLEDRTVPSTLSAASVGDLIADINAANAGGGSNTIMLAANTAFTLTAVDNSTAGPTGLPVIAAGDNLTIVGNGDTLARSTAAGTPAFRLLDVAVGGALTLTNVTLQGGWAFGSGVSAQGGAIDNQGALDLNAVIVQNNIAQGSPSWDASVPGSSAMGGGIYSGGALTLEGGTLVQNNQALGGRGADGDVPGLGTVFNGSAGGDGLGGGLYVAGGTVTLTSSTLTSNTARGGDGGNGSNSPGGSGFIGYGGVGGAGLGGGLYVAGGTVTLTNDTVSSNSAQGGQGGYGPTLNNTKNSSKTLQASAGVGDGGGIYINGASVCLDAFTKRHLKGNLASTSNAQIDGSYSTC